MGENTKISWCDHTANLWWGCQEVHAGCDHCYARTFDKRVGGAHWGPHAARRAIKSVWSDLAKWQKSAEAAGVQRRVFCGSMMDIFEVSKPLVDVKGNSLPGETADLRNRLFNEVVPASPNLLFLFLTKRPQNIIRMIPAHWQVERPSNVMFGYSAVNQETADQGIPHLLRAPSRHFLSCEPLLGSVSLLGEASFCLHSGRIEPGVCHDECRERQIIDGISWVIVGGESGHGARPMQIEWAESLRDQCQAAGVAYFCKQLGGHPDPRHELQEFPVGLQVREFPQ